MKRSVVKWVPKIRVRAFDGWRAALGFFRANTLASSDVVATGVAVLASTLLLTSAANASIVVNSNGGASSGMALTVPPGIASMSPQLSLAYTDGGVNGPLGVGWSLQGVSMVTRCGASKAIDGTSRSVDFSGADKLCLDGQRLIQTDENGNPAANANAVQVPVLSQVNDAAGLAAGKYREFRTEKDSFARVRAYGSAGGNVENGPATIRVWTKSGQVYEYGLNSEDAADDNALIYTRNVSDPNRRPVMVWAVRRVSDVDGNYIGFKYIQSEPAWGSGSGTAGVGREWNVAEIAYTGNSRLQTPAANKVVFAYEERPAEGGASYGLDRGEAYQFDTKNVSIQRLTHIRTYVNAQPGSSAPLLVRTYKLAYERAPVSGRSRLKSVSECAGKSESRCMPPTRYSYLDGAAPHFSPVPGFPASELGGQTLTALTGNFGVLTGDFNGDGRTDVLRWTADPAVNRLYLSDGQGDFHASAAFNLTAAANVLFQPNGCAYSVVADFNGDGLSDILRAGKSTCGRSAPASALYLASAGGSFLSVPVNAAISLQKAKAKYTNTPTSCMDPLVVQPSVAREPNSPQTIDNYGPLSVQSAAANSSTSPALALPPGDCRLYARTEGRNFYVLDVDGDGIADIVTALAPAYSWNSAWGPAPSPGDCSANGTYTAGPCTRVFRGQPNGQFAEMATDAANQSLYRDPTEGTLKNPYWRLPDVADIDGDGLMDILSSVSGNWRSLGNGNFAPTRVIDASQYCGMSIDFNGDGRGDCLRPDSSIASQTLTLAYGATISPPLTNFNINTPGNELYMANTNGAQTVGAVVADFDGDGREDILRWGASPSENGIYLSNGDGSFRPRVGAGLDGLALPLQSTDGTSSFILGDFLGIGSNQILHVNVSDPATNLSRNQLYVKDNAEPIDLLESVYSPTNLRSQAIRKVLLDGRYLTDRGTPKAATGNQVDISPPIQIINSVRQETASGTTVTEYFYKGLKAERGGRGWLGFRETLQQNTAPDGSPLTTATEFVQIHPYIGMAAVSKTYRGSFYSEWLISQTTNGYCDRTSTQSAPTLSVASGGVAPSPCTTTAKVQRPYLAATLEEGWDFDAAWTPLPKVLTTNVYNDWGDPRGISVLTVGKSVSTGADESFNKVTVNEYDDPVTGGEKWILGRLRSALVYSTVPNSIPSTSAGTSPHATDRTGSGPVLSSAASLTETLAFGSVVQGTSAELTATLTNTGNTALSVSAVDGSSVSGADFSLVNSTCSGSLAVGASCNVTVRFSPTAGVSRSGTLTLNTEAGIKVATLSGTGTALPSATLTPSLSFGTQAQGSISDLAATLTNTGTTVVTISAVSASVVSGADFSFVSTTCSGSLAAGASCAVTVRFSPTAAAYRSGSLSVSTSAGTKVTALSGTGGAPALLVLGYPGHPANSTIGWGAVQVGQSALSDPFTLQNSGGSPAQNLSIAAPAGWQVQSSTCGASLAVNSSCTFRLVFAPTAAQPYFGNITVTAGASSAWYELQGTGVAASLSLSHVPGGTDLGGIGEYSDSGRWPVFVNNGVGPVEIRGHASSNFAMLAHRVGSCAPGSVVAAGATCNTFVSFYVDQGDYAATETLTYRAVGTSTDQTVTVGYSAQVRTAFAINNSISFGLSPQGVWTAPQRVRFINEATNNPVRNVSVGFSYSSQNPNNFSVTSNECAGGIPAGGYCDVWVAFNPTSNGQFSADLYIKGDYPRMQPEETSYISGGVSTGAWLTGTAVTNRATLVSSTLVQLDQWYGATGGRATITYQNVGNVPMTLANLPVVVPLSIVHNDCNNVAPTGTCTQEVQLNTTQAGAGGTGVQTLIPAGATSGPEPLQITWTIRSAVSQWGTTALNFGTVMVGQSSTQSVTLYNQGSTAYNWVNGTVLGVPAGFRVDLGNCLNVAPNGGSCTAYVTFQPTNAQAYGGSGLTPLNQSYALNTLAVSGTGVFPPGPRVWWMYPSINYQDAEFNTISWDIPDAVRVSLVCTDGQVYWRNGNYGSLEIYLSTNDGDEGFGCTVRGFNSQQPGGGLGGENSPHLIFETYARFDFWGWGRGSPGAE